MMAWSNQTSLARGVDRGNFISKRIIPLVPHHERPELGNFHGVLQVSLSARDNAHTHSQAVTVRRVAFKQKFCVLRCSNGNARASRWVGLALCDPKSRN